MAEKPDVHTRVLDDIQQGLACQWDLLTRVEAGQIPRDEIAGLARRLDEMADAVHTLGSVVLARPRRRPWWWTPALCTLMFLLGAGCVVEAFLWQPVRMLVFPAPTQQAVPQVQKGKK
jgi:hypothetical protein